VTSDAIIYLPGIMGSELVDAKGDVVWGLKPSLIFRQAIFGNVLDQLALRANDGIRASRPIQFPAALPMLSSMEPYRALEERLKTVVVAPEAVRPFAYDWRKSIADAASLLAPVARQVLSEVNTSLLLGAGQITETGPRRTEDGGLDASWALSWPEQRAAGIPPIVLLAHYGGGFHHPHLRGSTVRDWPLNVFTADDAAGQLCTLRAIASGDLHNLVYRADFRIVPAVTAG